MWPLVHRSASKYSWLMSLLMHSSVVLLVARFKLVSARFVSVAKIAGLRRALDPPFLASRPGFLLVLLVSDSDFICKSPLCWGARSFYGGTSTKIRNGNNY